MLRDQKFISEENVLRLEKGKRGILNILFGRTTIILAILAFQFVLMFMAFRWLEHYTPYIWGAGMILAVGVVIHIMNRPDDPTVKLTWTLLVAVLPFFGTMLYLWIRNDIGHRLLHKRLDDLLNSTKGLVQNQPELLEKIKNEEKELYDLATYLHRYGSYPVFREEEVKYYPSGESHFEDLLLELEKARQFIFLEYFIIDEGYMWGRVLSILRKKVQEGVEVRVMYDGTCAIFKLPYSYPKKLEKLGIRCKMFAPLRPMVSTHYNNRDHRKILVIDGHTAFTGGVNLADEYINRRNLYGHWKDTAIMVRGEAVRSFTLMFLQMWNVDEKMERYDRYLRNPLPYRPAGRGYVLPYGDSPLDGERTGEMIYYDILNRAERYVHIMTPYLILDNEMITALSFAAKRGVEVQIIMPHIPDKEYAFALAKTYYKQLIQASVEIYEYLPGFVHAKVFTSDDKKAVVGTVNLDYRSLYHHFECGLYLHRSGEIATIEKDFQQTLRRCKKITLEDVKAEKLIRKVTGSLLKLVAPLM